MTAALWLGIGHYMLGVLAVFAFVVALMEASRKFDRFHDNSYLLLATGYFMLVAWALIRAMALNSGMLQLVAAACLVIGLICLASGYFNHHRAHPTDEENDQPVAKPKKAEVEKDEKLEKPAPVFKDDWMKMLSAKDEDMAEASEEADETDEDAAEDDSVEEAAEVTVPDKEPPVEPEGPEAEETQPEPEEKTPSKTKKAKEVAPAPEPTEEESSEVDLSYLTKKSNKAKAAPAPEAKKPASPPAKKEKSSKQETREEIMDDLFPLAHHAKKKRTKKVVSDVLPGEGVHDA